MGRWLTPNTIPTHVMCRALFIPDTIDWIAIVSGALLNLTYTSQWEKSGILTPQQCTVRMQSMLDEFTFNLPQLVSVSPDTYRISR